MKSIKQHIYEALKINSKSKVVKNDYKYFPKTKEELQKLLKQLMEERGPKGDFNDIDTSEITDMSRLFSNLVEFNGDISRWDVSNVETMLAMFSHSKFNGDISNWDISNVTNMRYMFWACKSFNQPLNDWNVSNVKNMENMFASCQSFNQDISNWDVSNVIDYTDIFDGCKIEEKYKPKFN